MFVRLWVWIPVLFTGWTLRPFSHWFVAKNTVCLKKTESKRKRGRVRIISSKKIITLFQSVHSRRVQDQAAVLPAGGVRADRQLRQLPAKDARRRSRGKLDRPQRRRPSSFASSTEASSSSRPRKSTDKVKKAHHYFYISKTSKPGWPNCGLTECINLNSLQIDKKRIDLKNAFIKMYS